MDWLLDFAAELLVTEEIPQITEVKRPDVATVRKQRGVET
jgi:hypothetical protein